MRYALYEDSLRGFFSMASISVKDCCTRRAILLSALLLWQCTSDNADAGSGALPIAGSGAGNAAGAGAADGAGAGSLPGSAAGSQGNAGSSGVIAGSPAGSGGSAGAMGGGPGAAGSGNGLPTAGASAGAGGIAAGSGGMAADGGAAAGPGMRSSGCGMADVPPSGSVDIEVDGTRRQLVVSVPSGYDPDAPYRLVLAWHGLGGTAMQTASSFFGLASRSSDSAIFVAGQAQEGGQGGFASWSTDGSDTDYARALIDWAEANYCIDVERVFSVGVSNGGLMSNMVGCLVGDRVRGLAAIAGGGPGPWIMEPCVGPVAAWITHGNQDDNVPFDYGEMSRDQWVELNQCNTTATPAMPSPCEEYQGCADGYPVHFCEHDGGHTVPSFTADAVWSFFARF